LCRPPRARASDQDDLHCRWCGRFPAAHTQGRWLDKFHGSQLFYRVKNPDDFAGKNLVIVGGGDSALDWALDFVKDSPHKAESVILIHRRDGFKAAPASVAKMKELCDAYEMQFIIGQITGFEEKESRSRRQGHRCDGVTRLVPLDVLLVFFGLSPKLGPIAEWGLDIERKQLKVDTEKFSTSVPGIFAVGDINIYPGKKKLILSGFPRMRAGRLWRHAHSSSPKRRSTCSTPPPAPSCTRCWAWSHPCSSRI
jgi:thioredoxin reductase